MYPYIQSLIQLHKFHPLNIEIRTKTKNVIKNFQNQIKYGNRCESDNLRNSFTRDTLLEVSIVFNLKIITKRICKIHYINVVKNLVFHGISF